MDVSTLGELIRNRRGASQGPRCAFPTTTAATPGAGLIDGVVFAAGSYYITSWQAGGVLRVTARGHLEELFALDSPASLGHDARRHQLIVPSLFGNVVAIYPLR
jgi:hypothetical protein